ncbi:MAG: hypothetical protein H7X99_09455 [Saprospiraceae bacterium]|nr:hypothetical protein [Saprospiraceae bacterium]
MKLRINGDSIRLRLAKTEVETLVNMGKVASACKIAGHSLIYQIIKSKEAHISATYVDDVLNISIHESLLHRWDEDERVGFDAVDKAGLYILVEKDFQCLKPRTHEDESGLYKNPQESDTSHG